MVNELNWYQIISRHYSEQIIWVTLKAPLSPFQLLTAMVFLNQSPLLSQIVKI